MTERILSHLWLNPPVERFGTLKWEEWGGGWCGLLSTVGRGRPDLGRSLMARTGKYNFS